MGEGLQHRPSLPGATVTKRRCGGNIVSFAAFVDNRPRRPISYGEPRGQVLLFTGVRREYMLLTDVSASCREAPCIQVSESLAE
jgi:hypothetical protein